MNERSKTKIGDQSGRVARLREVSRSRYCRKCRKDHIMLKLSESRFVNGERPCVVGDGVGSRKGALEPHQGHFGYY